MSGILYNTLIKKSTVSPGDTIGIHIRDVDGRSQREIYAKVTKVYKHHAMLDFGAYRECRRIADITLGLT